MAQSTDAVSSSEQARFRGVSVLDRLRQVGILIALLVIGLIFSLLTPSFLTVSNLFNIAGAVLDHGDSGHRHDAGHHFGRHRPLDWPIVALVTAAQATIMLAGTPVWLAILVGLGIGLVCGVFNGSIISYVGLQPFIVTLGTMSLYRGMALVIPTATRFSR